MCIKVSSLENKIFWEKQVSAKEIPQIKSYIDSKNNAVAIVPATLKPIRTNNFENFSKDFFLPTTINHAIRVENIVFKIFAILASLVLDVMTFPIRIFTCIPRIVSNAQRENLFQKYLKAEGADKELIETDRVNVKLEWKKANQSDKEWWEGTINLIEVPDIYGPSKDLNGWSGAVRV